MSEDKKKSGTTENQTEDYSAIPKNVLNLITKYASERAIEVYQKNREEGIKRRRDKRYRNAKLLIKKYKWLQEYEQNAVWELGSMLDEEEVEVLEALGIDTYEVREVKRIKDSVTETQIILRHIGIMLDLYKQRCLSSGKQEVERRWRVIEAMYLADDNDNAITIAEREHINERTVFKDIDRACEELSSLFFGIDLENILTI